MIFLEISLKMYGSWISKISIFDTKAMFRAISRAVELRPIFMDNMFYGKVVLFIHMI